jgi:hypothetical protein
MGGIASIVGSLFGIKKAQPVPVQSMTAIDIIPSTESATPESPVFGSSDLFSPAVKGKDALKIGLDKAANNQKTLDKGVK